MAVAFGGFSIREYAAKMRTVDVLKCYPFAVADNYDDEDTKKKKEAEAAALLPPMTVTKFNWWSHELHRSKRSNKNKEVLTLVNKESSDIPRNDIEFTAVEQRLDEVVAADGDGAAESEETLKSSDDDLSSLVCPVCKDFVASTVNGVNAHIDGCLASREERRRQMGKIKSKAPKKRSIAEIFAVAPQIQTHEKDLCERDDVDGDNNCKVLGESGSVLKATKKVKKRKKEKRVMLLEEENNNKKFKKKKIKMTKNDGLIANKDHSCKLKLQSSANYAKKLNKKFAPDIWDSVTARARTPNVKCLTAKKRKVVQTSKSFPKHKKPVFAVHSILKNHDVCGQNSTYCSMQSDGQSNPCGIQHSERHVKFSGTDHKLSPRNNGVSSFENNSDSFASSSEKDQSSDSNKEAAPMEVQRRKNDVSIDTDIGTESCSVIGRKELPIIPDHADIPSFLRPHMTHQEKVNQMPDKSVPSSSFAAEDNNLRMFDQGYLPPTHRPADSRFPRPIFSLEESRVSTQGATVSRDFEPSGKMIDHVVHPMHGVSAMSSKENTGAFPVSSSSSFIFNEKAKGRFPFLSQSEIDKFSDCGLHSQLLCPPMDLMGGSYPFPEWKQRTVTYRERCADEDFVGLPLNSHGELIQLRKLNATPWSSNGLPTQNFTHLTSISSLPTQNFTHVTNTGDCSTACNKHFLERELPSDRLNFFPMQNCVKQNPRSHIRDLFGATYLQSTQRADIHQFDFESGSSHSFRPIVSDRNLMNVSISECGQFDQVKNQKIGGMISKENSGHTPLGVNQPTMRLMGKDVAIGKSSREIQGFEDGTLWTDKEIIAEHCPSSTALDTLSLNRNFQHNWFPCTASGKLKEPAAQSFEIHREHAPQQNLMMKASESRFPHAYRNWQSHSMFENGSLTANRSPSSNLIRFAQMPTSPAMFNGAPKFREQFLSGAESLQSLQFGSQLPILSAPPSTCGHGVLRPAELNYKQNPPHFAKSSFGFPFLNPECRDNNVESSWFQSSSMGMPPWLLHATLQVNPPNAASQSFPNVDSRHHQHIMPRANFFNEHHSSGISYPCNFMTSHSQVRENAPTQATAVMPPLARAVQGVNLQPTSGTDMDRNRIKIKERLKTKSFSIKDPYPFKKTKRLAVKAVDSTKAANMWRLETQEKLSAAAGSSRGNILDEMQSNMRALDLDSSWKKASDLGCSQHDVQKDGFKTFGVESSKMDGVVRSTGPIKLCAGAKHIIKPTPNVDQDNSRSIHSTIPFVAVTNGFREPQPQKKTTKIYRF
ncbi:hypothetical protein C1H46_042861 [Malus baccata]|uniref:UBZ4-type domain-containing protein n=1 Tax=Malus baccata TaxID=106549 RepID=A0A540KBJ4_MALBA|nr:hypothetical protein C1H46_042861 [Malus baccata]